MGTAENNSKRSSPIVVTGAAGFIGRNTVATLNERGIDNVLLVDSLGKDEKWRNLVGLRYADLLTPDQFLELVIARKLQDVAAVIHLGACSSTAENDADFLVANNFQYTRTLCDWCLEKDIRFIYASSAATYGDGSYGYSDDDEKTRTLRPLNMYGYSKHMFDLWALRSGLFDRIVGLKYFNVFGPYEDHKGDMRSVVNKAYEQIIGGDEVALFKSYKAEYADGEQQRDFIYVKDAVDVTLHFLEHRELGGLFNCGTGKARTWKDLAMAVFAALDRRSNINFIEMPEGLRDKYQYFTQAEVTKLREGGEYRKEFTSLEDGIEDYVRNYLVPRDGGLALAELRAAS
ncbi:MAG TPA: ADP-glyceromanno-heptose 6-epimerase [Pyrinomonadaceae bacterium]|jgi:ADP-L-glycero-D-manno-heptose 6-epimerase